MIAVPAAEATTGNKIELINKLIGNGIINNPQYHDIKIEDIEMQTQESFFDYVFEDMRVFDQARQDGHCRLRSYFP